MKCKKPYVEEDRYLTAKKMRRAKYLANVELKPKPDLQELVKNVQMHQDTIAMYPMKLEEMLGEPLSDEEATIEE